MTVVGTSGAGPGSGPRGFSTGLSGFVGVSGARTDESGRPGGGGGTVVVRVGEVVVVRVAHIGNTELPASCWIWAIALSRLPDGKLAITCARSGDCISFTLSNRQSGWGCPGLMSENSLRAFRQPSR